jgi:hypothetical protein
MQYRHTQFGWVTVGVCGAVLVLLAWLPLPARARPEWVLLAPTFVVMVVVGVFGTLTVEVDDAMIHLRFGAGFIRKSFALADVASCRPVRNRWWWGWGIRRIPGGWLYNVSGLDAVELVLKNGKPFRIGTDEPRRLAEFIEAKLHRAI